MSLFLSKEQMWDMPLGGMSTEKQVPHWFGNIAYVLVAFAFKIAFRYRVVNRESLRALNDETGAVVICNHTSFLDVCMIYLAARPKQWVRLMGRDSLFTKAHGLLGQILSRAGAFPVKRDSADRTSIKRATRDLKNGEYVGILPEGTRRGKGNKIPSIHGGAALIARMAGVPILPMTVRGVEKVKSKGQRVRFPKVIVAYGDPILLEDFEFIDKEQRLDAISWYAMRECFALFYEVPTDEVDMVELFPEGEDFTALFAEHPIPRHTSEEVVAALRAKRCAKAEAASVVKARTASGSESVPEPESEGEPCA